NRVFSFVFALLISFGQVFSGFPGFMNIAYADDAPYGTISAKIEGQDSNGSVLKDKEFTLTVNFTIREDQECISGTYFKFMFDPTAVSYTKHSGKDTANPGALLSPSSDSGDPSTGSFVRQHTFEKVHSGTKWITTVYTFKALRDITAANNLDITVDIFKNFSEAYQKNIHGISIEPALANAGTHDLATIGGHDGTGKIILPVAKAVETKYTVTYAAGDGTGIVPTDSKSPYEKDAAVSVLGKGDLTKEGHSFDGWLNSVDNKKYNEGETFTITADTTLTAQWKKNADDVVPQDDPDGPKPDVPDNYVKVDFAAGEHGTIDAGEKTI
ncbi:InlB B-repeat-containing protein, partial [Enterococcus durans]